MFNYSKDGITIASYFDNRKPYINGNYPVKIRVTYKGIRKYYPTGKNLSIDEWNLMPTTKNKNLKEIRESVENSFSLVKLNVETLAEKGSFSFDTLNLRLSRTVGESINIAFKLKIETLLKEERIGTMNICQNVLNNIELFGGERISFDSITVDWLNKFEKYLLKDKNHTTVGMHMREIRTVINQAIKAEVMKESHYPFGAGKYEIKTGEGTKKALTKNQISDIINFSDGNETTEKYRDLWIFIYLCNGINVADMIKLKFKDIKDGEICFIRQKTERASKVKKEIRATLSPAIKSIIDKWGNKHSSENYIFPYLTGKEDAVKRKKICQDLTKRINKRMKMIGEDLKIGNITTYVARHSYATVLKRSGANIAYISESLGHKDLSTTENYLAGFEKGEREKNAMLLTDF